MCLQINILLIVSFSGYGGIIVEIVNFLLINIVLNIVFQWLRWHKVVPVLLVGTADGDVWMWNIPSSESKMFPGAGSKSTVGEFMLDG